MMVNLSRACILAAVYLLWQYLPESLLDPFLWSRPNRIFAQMVAWMSDGTLLWNAFDTFRTVVAGLLLGGIAGLVLGVVAGLSSLAGRLLIGPIQVLFAVPKITLVPLFILWLGIGAVQHVAFTALVVFFFFFFAVFTGIRNIPISLQNTLALMGASFAQRCRILILPACVGWIALSLKLAIPYAFVAAISTEVVASTSGLGNLVKNSASIMNSAGMFAAMLTLLLISLASSFVANAIASRGERFQQQ